MSLLYYHRPELARKLADDLLGNNPISDAPNGLFLGAPRRTGKSKFLRHDLQPELEARGCLVVYVDFWAQSRRDPAMVLVEALAVRIHQAQGMAGVLATILSKVKIAGVELDLSKVGQPEGTSIPRILELLSEESGQPIVLILDEAQHTLTTEAGESAMFALKSARDQMNSPSNHRLLLVFSGSDRDKLLRLVNSANAPFFGSQIHRMPELDRTYVERLANALEKIHPWLAPMNVDQMFEAFKAVGLRPQFLNHVVGSVLEGPQSNHVKGGNDILAGAIQVQEEDIKARQQLFLGLKPLEQYVLWRMLDQGSTFRPYDADSKAFYSALMERKVTSAMTQRALENLREYNPPVVWKSSRGEYAVEDTGMQTWFAKEKAAGTWPPNEDRDALMRRLRQAATKHP